MTAIRCILVVLCALLGTTAVGAESTPTLARSIGRVILESDRYPYGSHRVAEAIENEYRNTRKLPVTQRVRFFWSVMMNVRLDASYSVELVELIAHDCPEEFEDELLAFINKKRAMPQPEPQTSFARRMLQSLQMIRARNEARPPSR